jgi:molecular chaperone DnaK (HSP70)
MGIYREERFYEADTLTKRSRGPANCFIFSRLLIDLHANPSALEQVKKELILDYLQHPESDQLLAEFILEGLPEGTESITLMETVAMMLKYVKHEAEKHANGPVKDVVLTVPSHWTLRQRKFLIDAALLADMYVLSVIH